MFQAIAWAIDLKRKACRLTETTLAHAARPYAGHRSLHQHSLQAYETFKNGSVFLFGRQNFSPFAAVCFTGFWLGALAFLRGSFLGRGVGHYVQRSFFAAARHDAEKTHFGCRNDTVDHSGAGDLAGGLDQRLAGEGSRHRLSARSIR